MGLYEGEHIKNMNKLAKVLPAKKDPEQQDTCKVEYAMGYNQAIDDCKAAIERANLVRCPSVEELRKFIISEYYPSDERATLLARELIGFLKEGKQ